MEFSELIRTGQAQAELLRGSEAPPLRGTLCVTGHHLLLSPGAQATPDLWLLLLRSVDSIEKRVEGDSGTITLRCKDLRVLQLEIEGVEATLDIARSIEALSSLESVITSFPFFYRPKSLRLGDAWHFHPPESYYKRVARETNAWRLSEANEDFSLCPSYPRAVIVPRAVNNDALARSARFRQGGRFPVLSYYHAPSGTVSPAPPQTPPLGASSSSLGLLCTGLASSLPGCCLAAVAGLRLYSGSAPLGSILLSPTRTPPLSPVFGASPMSRPDFGWFGPPGASSLLCQPMTHPRSTHQVPTHSRHKPPRPGSDAHGPSAPLPALALLQCAVLRSSQPLTGPQKRRCAEDEELLRAVLAGARPGAQGFIVDTRLTQAAKQARMTGGGTESKAAYPGWKRLHRPLERGRPLQESFVRLVEACGDLEQSMDRWLSRLEGCRWLSHVKETLSTACLAAHSMEREGACILVHGAEGTDSTLLVTSLAQIILDPLSRTMAGFQELIEREWIQAGHPFQLRCAHSAFSHARPKHEAPTFLLFLDCVWQLGRQFPLSLEFGEGMLLALFDHAYASPFGTFLCNSEKERCLCEVRTRTHSLWSGLNQPKEQRKLRNPLYVPNPSAIWPSVEPQSLRLWQGLFLRWTRPPEPSEVAWEKVWQIVTDQEKAEGSQPTVSASEPQP